MKGIRWIVLSIIVIATFIAYLLRSSLSIVSESMMHDLGMNEYQLGMVFSAFAAGYTVFQFPGGILGDRFGARRVIFATAIAWGVLTAITAIIPGTDILSVPAIVAILVLTRFIFGIAQAPFFPVVAGGSIVPWFPVWQWGLPNGFVSVGATLGGAATAPIVVWLMGAYGWRTAMLFLAPAGILVGVLYRYYVTDDPKQHPKITADELALIASARPPESEVPEKGLWKHVLKNRNIQLITASYFCSNYVFYLFFSWFFFYLVDVKGVPATEAGVLTALQWVLGAVGAIVGGVLCDVLVKRIGLRNGPRWLAMAALLMAAAFLYVGAMSDNPKIGITLLCFAFACVQISEAPFWVATMAVSGQHASVGTGILNTGANIPGIIGGMMVPVTAGLFGWPTAMALGSVFAVTSALLWLLIRADEPLIATDAMG
jgi:ACS family glucarate transporter-like MFS transporter